MDYVWCPFNSEHKVRGTELRMHMATCQSMPVEKPAEPHLPKKKTNWNTLLPNPTRNVEVETRFYASQDPEKLLQCPYDSNHQIRACRFPYHLIKCKKNHTDIAMQLATCPFNARHLVPRAELSRHILSCDDRSCIEQDIAGEKSYYQRDASPCTWKTPPCEEDWDKDLQNNKATFMWGIPSYPVPSTSGTNILMDAKNSLGSGLRAPKSMPYILPWKMHTKRE